MVLQTHVAQDGFIQFIAGDTNGFAVGDGIHRDHRDVGGAAADIDHQIAFRFVHGNAGADGRGHGFLDQMHLPHARHGGRIDDGLFFHLGDTGGNAHHHARPDEPVILQYLFDEIGNHFVGDFKIGNDTILHGADGLEPGMGSAMHFFGLRADGFHIALALAVVADRHHRRFIQNDPFIFDVHQSVGRSQVHGDVGVEHFR